MDSLGHSWFPLTALGRQDDEEATPGIRSLQFEQRAAANFVPTLLLMEQKELRFAVAPELPGTINSQPGFLQLLVVPEEESTI
ncbi:hypothetical protein TNCV_4935141 [Trichonephila clavipes]|uniref:Uncharacterized protein n=1 Tax=Trichonephila clavipes TaxID=2585209 RepID=A0A8X6SJ82_TRICX|nr:hypothetical protein TNCV_4935141 [Trichonephila clavipes]